jgi:hypothetical protein
MHRQDCATGLPEIGHSVGIGEATGWGRAGVGFEYEVAAAA